MISEPKKGIACHKMRSCGHVFCLPCLRDFYRQAIDRGELSRVRCLDPTCARNRSAVLLSKRIEKSKVLLSPSELCQIGLAKDTVKRYLQLKYKNELDSDKDTVYCPRLWCGGAARSKKHRKPEELRFWDESFATSGAEEDEEEKAGGDPGAPEKQTSNPSAASLLAICEDCSFAFCSQCCQSWHGEFYICRSKDEAEALAVEEKASLEYIQYHTTPCPTCNAPAQKTNGCNHMLCSRCDTHFCYLCSSWLDPSNPYRHYNQQPNGKFTSCYMRLWELENGDGDDVDIAGNRVIQPPPRRYRQPALVGGPALNNVAARRAVREDNGLLPDRPQEVGLAIAEVAREGPLVLRVVVNPQAQAEPAERPRPNLQDAPIRRRPGREGRGGGIDFNNNINRRQIRQGEQVARRPRGEEPLPREDNDNNDNMVEELNQAQQEWIRNFVRLALLDQEDEIEANSDDDELFAFA